MKYIFAIINNPLTTVLSAVFGSAMMLYLREAATQSIMWFLPCMCIIIADLFAGIQAARFRRERVTFSTACRRTINKIICYVAWILFCVFLNQMYMATWPTWSGIGIIFFIEGCSFIGNILEPKGYSLSVKAMLAVIGRRHNMEGLNEVIEKKDGNHTR